jgi:hypothetical protein
VRSWGKEALIYLGKALERITERLGVEEAEE